MDERRFMPGLVRMLCFLPALIGLVGLVMIFWLQGQAIEKIRVACGLAQAIDRYAPDRSYTIVEVEDHERQDESRWEIVVDWQDDGPHNCTLVVHEAADGWAVVDDECQGD
jgi:hypothetical protein